MLKIRRLKNKSVTKLAALFPAIADRLIKAHLPLESKDVPWTPVVKPLAESKIALITTAGIHHRSQKPFDMADPQGDPTYRILDRDTIVSDYTITHDYYDHRDADTDLNIVLPIKRISEMQTAGVIGTVAKKHYSFMGHIMGSYVPDLVGIKAPEVAALLAEDRVDAVLLTPA